MLMSGLQNLVRIKEEFFREEFEDENFIPNPEKSDKSFFEKVKDIS
jgi:molecular chaperone DnaJ